MHPCRALHPHSHAAALRCHVAVPLFRAEEYLDGLLSDLRAQSPPPDVLHFLDSSDTAGTSKRLTREGLAAIQVPPGTFDHGATRNLALKVAAEQGAELLVFLTQDVRLRQADALGRLTAPFADPNVGATFGRQVPRRDAGTLERANRNVRYPAHSYDAAGQSGNRRYFLSNAFAAYRVSSLLSVSGFPSPSVFGEDAAASYRLQNAGLSVRYVADAVVEHSHPVRLTVEFRRFFDVGVSRRLRTVPREWSSTRGGSRAVIDEIAEARRTGGWIAATACAIVASVRLVGLTVGASPLVPELVGRRLSHSPSAYAAAIRHLRSARS